MIKVLIHSKRTGKWEINRCEEYDIDLAMDIPADHFNLVIGNPTGSYSDLFDDGDRAFVYVNGTEILSGVIDDIDDDEESASGTRLIVDGRDTSLLMVDNDALPATLNNVTLMGLAQRFGNPYGVFKYSGESGKVIPKLTINPGEREWDILDREARKQGKRIWMGQGDTVYIGQPNYNSKKQDYLFTNEQLPNAIPFEYIKRRRSGAGVLSEVIVHHFDSRKKTTKKDETLLKRGFHRRRIMEEDAKEATKVAEETLVNSKIGSYEITLRVKGTHLIQTNRIAKVVHKKMKLNHLLFVVGVNYRKGRDGSFTTVRLRKPGEAF